MTKEALNKTMKQYCISSVELEDVIAFVSDLLYIQAKEIEKNEPWAHVSINSLRNASREVDNLIYELSEIEEE